MIELEGIGRDYEVGGRPVHALSGIDLEIPEGDYVSIMGPSGSGKSTLLHLLGGLDRPDAGSIEVGGRRIDRLAPAELASFRNRTVGFVFQFHQLLADFTALENVALPGRIAGLEPRGLERRATALLDEVGLAERRGHFPSQLSGGEQQRTALCRALLLEPPLVLADEPTGNLDPAAAETVFDLLRALVERHGTTAVVVTHNRELAARCASIRVLEGGRLVRGNA